MRKSKNHYASLGIQRTATQADIKSAYYELSKIYHPDKSQASGSTQNEQKFREITEAYEVLGNVRSRKLYDKGFMIGNSPRTSDDPLHKFYKSRETRTRPPPPTGRTTIYDFDEWAKRHYGKTFQRTQEMRSRQTLHKEMNAKQANSSGFEKLFIVMALITLGSLIYKDCQDYDNPRRYSLLHPFISPKRGKKPDEIID